MDYIMKSTHTLSIKKSGLTWSNINCVSATLNHSATALKNTYKEIFYLGHCYWNIVEAFVYCLKLKSEQTRTTEVSSG
jgi:hypothetical protein